MPTDLLWFRSCAVCHGCHELLSTVMSRRQCLILDCRDLRLLQSFCLSYVMVPEALGVYNINVPPPFILAERPTVTDSLHFDWVSMLTIIECTKKNSLLWAESCTNLGVYRNVNLESTLILCQFSRILVGSTLGACELPSHGSLAWQYHSTRHVFPPVEWVLNPSGNGWLLP